MSESATEMATESAAAPAVEIWVDTNAPYVPNVTLRQNGTLAFSRGAQNKFQFGTSIQDVKLAYDRERRCVIIIPATTDEAAALPLKQVGQPFVLYCRKFFDRFDISFAEKKRFTLTKAEAYPGLPSGVAVYVMDLTRPLESDDSAESAE